MVAKDQYGLEYPWRARTLINMLPKPVRKILKTQINSVMGVVQGLLEGAAPGRILGWAKNQALVLFVQLKEKIIVLIQSKISGQKATSGGSGGGSERGSGQGSGGGSVRNKENSRSANTGLSLEVKDDIDIDSIIESEEILLSA